MYHPTTRVLTVLELLQSRGQISGPEIAARLEVDIRTARRYITMLQDLGIPVEAERGRYGAYRLRPGFKLPPLMLTDDEALALTVGLLVARRLGFAAAAPAVEGALAKVERVLPAALKERVRAVQHALIITLAAPDVMAETGIVAILSEAVQQRRRVHLRYRAWDGGESEREFDPYGLVVHNGYWYTAGHCHLRGALRTFRLDRVIGAELSEAAFTRPPDFDTLEHVQRSLASVPGNWIAEVLLETTLEEARQFISPSLAVLEPVEGGVLFRCFAQRLPWLAHYLAGLDCPMTILQPPELRDELRKLAARALALADRGT